MLKRLEIKNWRSIKDINIEFQRGMNFLVGKNGSGKTSIFEAIMFSFIGRVGLIDDAKLMVNKEAEVASISLTFELENEEYMIHRSLSKRRKLANEFYCIKEGKTELITKGDTQVTKEVMELLKIESAMFQRLIYLEEGDIPKFISKGYGIAIIEELERIIGLNYMRKLSKYLDKREKTLKKRLRSIESWDESSLSRPELRQVEVEDKIKNAKNRLEELEKIKRDVNNQLQREKALLRKQEEIFSKLAQKMREYDDIDLKEHSFKIELWKDILNSDRNKLRERREIEKKLKSLSHELEVKEYGVQREIETTTDIQKLLQVDATLSKCPVCLRELDEHLAKHVTKHHATEIKMRENELRKIGKEKQEIHKKILLEKDRISKYNQKCSILEQIITLLKTPYLDFTDKKQRRRVSKIEVLNKQKEQLIDEENRLSKRLMEYYKILGRWEQILQAPRILEKKMKLTFTQSFLNLYIESIKVFIEKERTERLKELLNTVANNWNKFWGTDIEIDLDNKSLPVAVFPNYRLSLREMSGGEKSILFTITRAMFSRLLCPKINLIIIDEPLEHLDIKNRRLLLEFLFEAQQKGVMDQIIVATFEESLTRNYLDPLRANFIGLSVDDGITKVSSRIMSHQIRVINDKETVIK